MTLIPGIKQISQVGNDMYIQGVFPVGVATTKVGYLADPADTRLLAGRDPVIEEVSVGMSGSETDIKTATGAAPLQITDAMQGMLRFLETNIKPVQDLHGYAKPWPAGGGKNLLSYPYGITSQTVNGCTLTVQNDGTITFSGIPSSQTTWNIKLRTSIIGDSAQFLPEGTYKLNGTTSGASASTFQISVIDSNGTTIAVDRNTDPSFTIPSGGMNIGVQIYVNANYDPSSLVLKPMIRLSSDSDATFAPYANICPIQGWTGCNVYVSPTTNQADATVYPCTWQDAAGTVYGGTIDLVSGWMTVTHVLMTLNTADMDNSESYPGWKDSGVKHYVGSIGSQEITSMLNIGSKFSVNTSGANDIIFLRTNVYGKTQSEWQALAMDVQILIPLATPQYIQVPGNHILTQEGTNYIWTDCGDTITAAYVAVK